MPYNVDMMLSVRNAIAAHPGQHEQAHWSSNPDHNPFEDCGTTACIAGWTLAVNGLSLSDYRAQVWSGRPYHREWDSETSLTKYCGDLLGLDADEAYDLFLNRFAENDALAQLDEYIQAGKEGRKASLVYPAKVEFKVEN